MKLEFLIKTQDDIDRLTHLVRTQIESSNLTIVPTGAMRSKTRPIDFRGYDFKSNNVEVGKFEYDLKDGIYHVELEMQIPEIYDRVVEQITKLYPGLLEPVGQ